MKQPDVILPHPDTIASPYPDYMERAARMMSSAKRVFHDTLEVVSYLNAHANNHFVAAVYQGRVIIGPGGLHPDEVIARFVETGGKGATEVEMPTVASEVPDQSVMNQIVVTDLPGVLDLKVGSDPNYRPSTAGSPPKFKGATVRGPETSG